MDLQTPIKRSFLKEKIYLPVLNFLKTGSSPEQLAVAFALGTIVGIIPLWGVSTLLCALLAFAFRLNLAAMQLVNYLIFPLQLLFYIPFFQAGGVLFEPLTIPLSASQISEMLSADPWGSMQQLWLANLQALLVWLMLAVPVYFGLYFILLPVLKRISAAIPVKNNHKAEGTQ